jgi:hypothetical protein
MSPNPDDDLAGFPKFIKQNQGKTRSSENGENSLPETPIFLQHTDRAFSVSESLALLPEI